LIAESGVTAVIQQWQIWRVGCRWIPFKWERHERNLRVFS